MLSLCHNVAILRLPMKFGLLIGPILALLVGSSMLLPALAGAATAPPPATAPQPDARAVMDKIIHDAITILRDPNLNRDQKREKVTALADGSMDFQVMSALAMGRSWRGLTAQQQSDFTGEFKQHVALTYGHTTDQYTDEDVKITGSHDEARGDVTVETTIIGTNDQGVRQDVAKVNYRLREAGGNWKIIDVMIDGVSLVQNFRSQFQEIMEKQGFDKLLKLLHDKNAAGEK